MSVWMEKVFLQVLNMSLMAIYCILVILVIRLLLKKQPKIFSYALWLIVLFRLVCPISFESSFSAFRIAGEQVITSQGIQNVTHANETEVGITENVSADNLVKGEENKSIKQSEKNVNQISFGKNEVNRKSKWLGAEIIWLVGSFGMLSYALISAALLKRKLKVAVKREDYYEVAQLETPFVFGIIRPRIYLPTGLSDGEICYILEHERTHIRRCDYLIKPLAFLVLCIHWFNLFVWLAFFCMEKDMEMSCDEAVLQKLGKEIKREYSTSLLNLACDRRFLNGSPLAFGERAVKGRIKNILDYKKPGFWGLLLAVIVIVVVGVTLISNPKTSKIEMTEKNQETNERAGDITSDEKLPVYQKEQEEEVKELLTSYGGLTEEEMQKSLQQQKYFSDIVIAESGYDNFSNLERWDAFYNHAQAEEADAVVIINRTVEGDACLAYVSYQNGSYYLLCDYTRDQYAAQSYESAQFSALKEYADFGYVTYYLVVEKEWTREEVESNVWNNDLVVYPICSFEYERLESILGSEKVEQFREEDIEFCICEAILEKNKIVDSSSVFQTEAHQIMQKEEKDGQMTVYAHVLHQSYDANGKLESESYIPTAITFTQDDRGAYSLKEYWIPRDGSDYKADIEEKFPENIWEEALDGQFCIGNLQNQCEQAASRYFSGQ